MARKTYGIDKDKAKKFFNVMGSLASNSTRKDPDSFAGDMKNTYKDVKYKDFEGLHKNYSYSKELDKQNKGAGGTGLVFDTKKQENTFLDRQNRIFGQDTDSLIKAFRLRQDSVFSQRARPGVSAQTRLV